MVGHTTMVIIFNTITSMKQPICEMHAKSLYGIQIYPVYCIKTNKSNQENFPQDLVG